MTNVKKSVYELAIIDQIRTACDRRNRLATAIGFLLGAFVPFATFIVAHYQVTLDSDAGIMTLSNILPAIMVAGGLTYSANTVFHWGQKAFGATAKALGFVVLVELVMVTSNIPSLTIAALVYLMLINGIATGCQLALDGKVKRPSNSNSKKKVVSSKAPKVSSFSKAA